MEYNSTNDHFSMIGILNDRTNNTQATVNDHGDTLNNHRALFEEIQKNIALLNTGGSGGTLASLTDVDSGNRINGQGLVYNLANDISLALAAQGVRIEAPVPGKSVVGIEVPNPSITPVRLKEIATSRTFQGNHSKLAFCIGKDLSGHPIIGDLEKMPHLLIAGTTGSGKSVCINSIISSILLRTTPDEVRATTRPSGSERSESASVGAAPTSLASHFGPAPTNNLFCQPRSICKSRWFAES